MKLLSIVIPIYNVELYLEKCLQSITSQINGNNDQEIEIILVNDGSKDNSGNIAEKYSEKYSYISL
ncbi:glycosyltransferase, partial [Alkalihalophilus pseudofirmus]